MQTKTRERLRMTAAIFFLCSMLSLPLVLLKVIVDSVGYSAPVTYEVKDDTAECIEGQIKYEIKQGRTIDVSQYYYQCTGRELK